MEVREDSGMPCKICFGSGGSMWWLRITRATEVPKMMNVMLRSEVVSHGLLRI